MSKPTYNEMLHHIIGVGGCYCESIMSSRGITSALDLPAIDNMGELAERCLICRCRDYKEVV